MKVAVFSTKPYDRDFLAAANLAEGSPHELLFLEPRLTFSSVPLIQDAQAVCAFVNDTLDRQVLEALKARGVRLVALRSAGFNHVDVLAARDLEVAVGRVPAYSPEAVAEHAAALILSLNRKIHRAYVRVREGNFALDGLLGFNLHGRTVGIVGTGKIGMAVARIMRGFGCRLLALDVQENPEFLALGGRYSEWQELLAEADVLTLHCPLTPQTHHLIDATAIGAMKRGSMLINTGRGALVDTHALIRGLKSGQIGQVGLDVYEEESDLFFENLSGEIIQDDLFARLLTFPNVLITGHQAFFTEEALSAIAQLTIENITQFERTGKAAHPVSAEMLA